MEFTQSELEELRDNPTFRKLEKYFISQSLGGGAEGASIEEIAKIHLTEAGRMDVFRTVPALIQYLKNKNTPKQTLSDVMPFEHIEQE